MSEDVEVVEAEETEEVKADPPRPKDLPDDQEWDRVDFYKDEPEKIERRFNRLYATMKQQEGALKATLEDHGSLARKVLALEEKLTKQERADLKADLLKQKATALDEGDNRKVVEIDDRLADLRAAPVKKEQPRQQPPADPGWFTPDRQQALVKWASETDQKGNHRRPWAQEGHPKNARAIEITNAVINDPEFSGAEINEILEEVDRLMAPRGRTAPAVLSGKSDERPGSKEKVSLTADQKYVAQKMGLSPEEYAAALKD